MFSLMGNCISCAKKRKEPRKEVTLAILGLDSAGKTTTTKGLRGESLETAPTIGFSNEEFTFGNFDIKLYDLGGGKKIRDIWPNYFADIYGIIYVVDSSAPDRMEETKYNLHNLLEHDKISGKPLLLLANKQDLGTAMDEVDICEQLKLEDIVNMNKCPCRIEKCSAIKGTGKKMDPSIRDGLKWLCNMISNNWDKMKERVDKDVEEEKRKQKIEADARRERVRKIREERERKEKEEEEEKRRMGIIDDKEESEEEDIGGDPFKRLDVNELRKKELKLKEEKAKRKEFEKRRQNKQNLETGENTGIDDLEDMRVLRSNRALQRYDLFNGHLGSSKKDNNSQKSDDDEDDDFVISARRSTPRLPPLQHPIGTKFSFNAEGQNMKTKKKKKKDKLQTLTESEDETLEGNDNLSQTLRSVSKIDFDTKNGPWSHNDIDSHVNGYRSRVNLGHLDVYKNFENERISPRNVKRQNHLDVYGNEDNTEVSPRSGKKKGKKKKKLLNTEVNERYSFDVKDLTSPRTLGRDIDEESEDSLPTKSNGIYSISSNRQRTKLPNLDGGHFEDISAVKKPKKKKTYVKKNKTAPSDDEYEMRNNYEEADIKRDYSWTRSPKRENIFGKDKWNLAEDLPEIDSDDDFSRRRLRPNIESDDDIIT